MACGLDQSWGVMSCFGSLLTVILLEVSLFTTGVTSVSMFPIDPSISESPRAAFIETMVRYYLLKTSILLKGFYL